MTIQEFREYMAVPREIGGWSDVHLMFHSLSQRALRITAEINGKYHTPEELHTLLEELMQRELPKDLGMFPPFYTDCGVNTVIGERVFINMGCKFQDQGGISIGDGSHCGCRCGGHQRRGSDDRGGRRSRQVHQEDYCITTAVPLTETISIEPF